MELIAHPDGGYRFLTGIDPYSAGVVAERGLEIVHVTLGAPVPWRAGFDLVEARLRGAGRPRAALCAMALRSPAPFSFEGFGAFNAGYQAKLAEWGVYVGDHNPVARTNVAPIHATPTEPCLYSFAYTVPEEAPGEAPTFVVAGAGDLADQADLSPAAIVRPGETGPDAMTEKAATVMERMSARLQGLGAQPAQVTVIDVYCVHPIHGLLASPIFSQLGPAAIHGVHWHPSHPPIEGLAFEMDLRGVRREVWLR
jgi:hypothetical protein